MYLLDTNHCSRIIDGERAAVEQLRQVSTSGVAINVIVWGELVFMAENSAQRDRNRPQIRAFLASIDFYPIDDAIAQCYGGLKAKLFAQFGPRERAKRRQTRMRDLGVSDNDLWIAATAVCHGLTIVSADTDFQRIGQVQELATVNWLERS